MGESTPLSGDPRCAPKLVNDCQTLASIQALYGRVAGQGLLRGYLVASCASGGVAVVTCAAALKFSVLSLFFFLS